MQALLCSAASQLLPLAPSSASPPLLRRPRTLSPAATPLNCRPSLSSFSAIKTLFPSSIRALPSFSAPLIELKRGTLVHANAGFPSSDEESERAKLAQVSKRLENTSRYFKRLGSLGFWGQLVCTVVSAVILAFSAVVTGKITSPVTFYTTAGGIAAAFVSVFWSFGYMRLSERLRRTANDPAKLKKLNDTPALSDLQEHFRQLSSVFKTFTVFSDPRKAPPRPEVVKSLKNGIVLNLLGMGAAILGMQATVGLLVAKALTTSTAPFYQGITPGQSPVIALDVFLVQASANTILSHFLGLVFSLELLRSVTLPHLEAIPVPKAA